MPPPPPTLSKHLYKMTLCKWAGWRAACKTDDTCFLQHPAASHRRPPRRGGGRLGRKSIVKNTKNNNGEGKKKRKKKEIPGVLLQMNQAETCSVLILAKSAAGCVFPRKCSRRLARMEKKTSGWWCRRGFGGVAEIRRGADPTPRGRVQPPPHPTLLGPPSIPAC